MPKSRARREAPLVSIVVNNFNYGEFLPDAIDSALAQRDADVDVIVVDDGSTDDSRRVIRRYDNRVRTLFKENRGQASAFNAGFGVSRGEVVIFLDADDMLLPTTAARVAKLFARRPELAKVHYRLEVVDRAGEPTGFFSPAAGVELPEGDLRGRVLRSPDDVPHPPTSGNAFSAAVLERILPMPEREYRRLADVYLINLASLLGPVGRLDAVGGRYRQHGRNAHLRTGLELDSVRSAIRTTRATHAHLAELASSLGLRAREDFRPASVTDLAQRLISQRLEPDAHPIDSDRRVGLAVSGAAAALRHRDLDVRRRLLYTCWFVAAGVAPRRVARALAERLFEAWRSGLATQSPPAA